MLTKGLALFVPAWIFAAHALAWRRQRVAALIHGTCATVLALASGGWWWVRNLAVHGQFQPYGAPLPDYRTEAFTPAVHEWLPYFLSRMVLRFWGSLGWFDVHLPWWLVWLVTALSTIAVGVVIVGAVRRRVPPWPCIAVLLAPLAALVLGTALASWSRYSTRASIGGIQGRYLFGGVAGAAAVITLGLAHLARSLSRLVPLWIGLAAGMLHAVALHRVVGHYWAPDPGDAAGRVASMVAWYPWPPAVAALGPLLVVAGVALLLTAIRRLSVSCPAGGAPSSGERGT